MNCKYDFKGQYGIVTGAASGIGKAIASLLARAGAGLALADRDKTGLEAICAELTGAAATEPLAILADVSGRKTSIEWSLRRWPVLIGSIFW